VRIDDGETGIVAPSEAVMGGSWSPGTRLRVGMLRGGDEVEACWCCSLVLGPTERRIDLAACPVVMGSAALRLG
jgi:hypothetical protein